MYPSIWQIVIVLAIFILLFGHKRIKELGKSLGEALRDFRKGLEDSPTSEKKNSTTSSPTDTQKSNSSDHDDSTNLSKKSP